MTHLLQSHLARLGFIREKLGYNPDSLIIIILKNSSDMIKEVFRLAGYQTISTNMSVKGTIFKFSYLAMKGINFHIIPYLKKLDIPLPPSSLGKNLALARKGTRRISNIKDIECQLSKRGFQLIYFEDMSIEEQWSSFKYAENIIGIHGAGLGALSFCKNRVNLIELYGPGFVVNVFRKYMAILNGQWVGCRGKLTPDVIRNLDKPNNMLAHKFDDFEISIESIDSALDYLKIQANN